MKKINIANFFLAAVFICTALLVSCDVIDDDDTPSFQVYDIMPADGSTDVSTGVVISISFSAEVNKDTATTDSVSVSDSYGMPVAGKVDVSGVAVSFAPASKLEYLTAYTVTITTQLQDIHGRSLPEDYKSTFSTVADASAEASGSE